MNLGIPPVLISAIELADGGSQKGEAEPSEEKSRHGEHQEKYPAAEAEEDSCLVWDDRLRPYLQLQT
jgi:hypothetical protein